MKRKHLSFSESLVDILGEFGNESGRCGLSDISDNTEQVSEEEIYESDDEVSLINNLEDFSKTRTKVGIPGIVEATGNETRCVQDSPNIIDNAESTKGISDEFWQFREYWTDDDVEEVSIVDTLEEISDKGKRVSFIEVSANIDSASDPCPNFELRLSSMWSVISEMDELKVEVFWFAEMMVQHPLSFCCLIMACVVVFSGIAVWGFELDKHADYSPQSYTAVRRANAYELAIGESYESYDFGERTQPYSFFDIFIWAKMDNGGNVFTPSIVKELINIEQNVMSLQKYSDNCLVDATGMCHPPLSILSDLEGLNQTEINSYLLDVIATNDVSRLATMSADISAESLESDVYRSVHYMGSPLPGYATYVDRQQDQIVKFNKWAFQDYYYSFRDLVSTTLTEPRVYSSSYSMTYDIYKVAETRAYRYLGVSIISIFFLLAIFQGSVYLGVVGMLCITLSFVLAYVVYTYVWGIHYFDPLMIAIVYVIIGIGADDIFVFTDAWTQASLFVINGDEDQATRMSYTFVRASKAMALTQITTVIGFLATAVSDITSIKAFGFWAATCIAMAYVLVITILPLALVIRDKYQVVDCGLSKCGKPCTSKLDDMHEKFFMKGPRGKGNTELFFGTTFLDLLYEIRYISVLGGVIFCLFAIWVALTCLSTPTKPLELLVPCSYEGIALNFLNSQDFASASESTTLVQPLMTWGILSVDRSNVKVWDLENKGELVVDDQFDPSPEENQQFLLDFCEVKIPKMLKELSIADVNGIFCPIMDFKQYLVHHNLSFPVPKEQFNHFFVSFLFDDEYGVSTLGNALAGIRNGKVLFISVMVPVDLYIYAAGTRKKPVYDAWESMVSTVNMNAPTGVNNAVQLTKNSEWSLMSYEEALVKGAIHGICIALPTAFFIILIFTGNLVISLFAIFTICEIVLSVTTVIVFAGWDFGIVESTCVVYIIGFSVDYVVHLGHAYWEVRDNVKTRKGRAKIALMTMGSAVTKGAITTFFGGLPLIFTELVFFKRLGLLMMFTVSFSWFWSMFLFMPLLIICGPKDNSDEEFFTKSVTVS